MLRFCRNWIHPSRPRLVLIVFLRQKHWTPQIISLAKGAVSVIRLGNSLFTIVNVRFEFSCFERRVAGACVLFQSAIFGTQWLRMLKVIQVKISSNLLFRSLNSFSVLRHGRSTSQLLSLAHRLVASSSVNPFVNLSYLSQVDRRGYIDFCKTCDLWWNKLIQFYEKLFGILLRNLVLGLRRMRYSLNC